MLLLLLLTADVTVLLLLLLTADVTVLLLLLLNADVTVLSVYWTMTASWTRCRGFSAS